MDYIDFIAAAVFMAIAVCLLLLIGFVFLIWGAWAWFGEYTQNTWEEKPRTWFGFFVESVHEVNYNAFYTMKPIPTVLWFSFYVTLFWASWVFTPHDWRAFTVLGLFIAMPTVASLSLISASKE